MIQRRMLNGLIGLLLLLSACSSPASPTAAPLPTRTPMPAAIPTVSVPAAVLVPTTTPLPTATLGPTATTQGPTNTPAPTADPLHTACDHPYFPMRLGAAWVIKYKTNVITSTVTAVTGDTTHAQATLTQQYSNGDVWQLQYVCSQDGISLGGNSAKYANGTVQNSDIVTSTGELLLTADKLTPGGKWSYSQTVDGFFPNKVLVGGKVGYKPAHHHDTFIRGNYSAIDECPLKLTVYKITK